MMQVILMSRNCSALSIQPQNKIIIQRFDGMTCTVCYGLIMEYGFLAGICCRSFSHIANVIVLLTDFDILCLAGICDRWIYGVLVLFHILVCTPLLPAALS